MSLPISTVDPTWNTGDAWAHVHGPGNDPEARAQEVTVIAGERIDSIALRAVKGSQVIVGDDDDAFVTLHTSLGAYPSTVLATSQQVATETLPLRPSYAVDDPVVEAFTTFTFTSPYTVTSSGSLWVVLQRTMNLGGFTSKALSTRQILDVYAGGSSWQYDNLTDFEWTEDFGTDTYDWEFTLTGAGATTLYVGNAGFRFPYPRWT